MPASTPKQTPEKTTGKAKSQKQPKKIKHKLDIWNRLAVVVLSLFLVACITVFFVLVNIINDPDGMRFSQDGLSTLSTSRIYDSQGAMIYEVGPEIREDVTYEQLPQSVIDAFLSIEDSRYFTHSGFDLPRFVAAALANIRTGSLGQGGSTLTMQMIDNAFTKNKEAQIQEANGGVVPTTDSIRLKIQEIYLALTAEQSLSKEQILEYYVNRIWFGSSWSTRGIQKAAQYYFNKDISEVNLPEAAFLAGLVNAPNTYNPLNNKDSKDFDYLEAATKRRNVTLQMMLNHGYITEEEYELAKNTDLSFAMEMGDVVVTTDPNQAYIDQVLQEVTLLTAQDPTIIPMDIYTALNQDLQQVCDNILTGDVVSFPNDAIDVGFAILQNDTGEILAVGPGRNYHDEKVKHDLSMTLRQPGSTMKPLLAYAPAFDILGWSTTHTVVDKADDYFKVGRPLVNSYGYYRGSMSLQDALGYSSNTTAAATMVDLIEKLGYGYWIDYCEKLGYDTDICEQFVDQYVIGGSEMRASPIQQASAYSNFANQGTRVNAHRVRKVIRRSDKEEIKGNSTEYEIVSEQAAFMISTLLEKVVTGNYQNMNNLLAASYPVYAKSGTTDWDANNYGIPAGVARDSWSLAYTSDFTFACWSGYTAEYEAQGYYLNNSVLFDALPFRLNKYLIDYCAQYGSYKAIPQPDDVSPYGNGWIETKYLEAGDATTNTTQNDLYQQQLNCQAQGGTWDYNSGACVVNTPQDNAQYACEASGGIYNNGACSCPDGYELNGTACQPKTDDSDKKDEENKDQNDVNEQLAAQCTASGGTFDATTGVCTYGTQQPDQNGQPGTPTGLIFPFFRRLFDFF